MNAAASIDNDLVETTKRLSMGASIVTNLNSSNCKLPMKLHPALYNSSLSDISMGNQRHDAINKNNNKNNVNRCTIGVPGFPDFPDCWHGETPQRNNGDMSMSYADKKHKNKCTTTSKARIKRQRRKVVRMAVNVVGISKKYTSNTACTGKTIKKRNRDQRKMRRIEKVAQLQNRRRRKREIGLLCKSLSSIKC